jgi:hypothetical protein
MLSIVNASMNKKPAGAGFERRREDYMSLN